MRSLGLIVPVVLVGAVTLGTPADVQASIKHKKIVKLLKRHAKKEEARINKEFGTQFRWSYDWKIVGADVAKWNLSDDQLKQMFNTMAVTPIETALGKLMKDEDYAAAIKEQVKLFKWVSEESADVWYYFEKGVVTMKGSLRPNYDSPKPNFAVDLQRVLEEGLQ